jgi:hypothetical protein
MLWPLAPGNTSSLFLTWYQSKVSSSPRSRCHPPPRPPAAASGRCRCLFGSGPPSSGLVPVLPGSSRRTPVVLESVRPSILLADLDLDLEEPAFRSPLPVDLDLDLEEPVHPRSISISRSPPSGARPQSSRVRLRSSRVRLRSSARLLLRFACGCSRPCRRRTRHLRSSVPAQFSSE